jgi:NADH-quinone oxidoreductase subunit N
MLLLAGLASVILGGLLILIQRALRAMLGYAALFDLGCLLIALSVQGAHGALVLYASLATRALGLTLLGIATETLLEKPGEDSLTSLRGVGRRQPLATVALMIGSFTLAGTPLAAGFAGRWLMLRDLAQLNEQWAWLVVLAGLGVVIAYLRTLFVLARPDEAGSRVLRPIAILWIPSVVLLILSLASIALGVFPNPILHVASMLVILYPLPQF